MEDSLVDMAVVVFTASLLLGPACGALFGWRMGVEAGIALGCLVIGGAAVLAAGVAGWQRWQLVSGTEVVQGQLVGYISKPGTDSKGRAVEIRDPLVVYVAADGEPRQIKGLSGSPADLAIGASVEVRYRRENPADAVLGDAQNIWGLVWVMGFFGLLPTLFGLLFASAARRDRAARRARPLASDQ